MKDRVDLNCFYFRVVRVLRFSYYFDLMGVRDMKKRNRKRDDFRVEVFFWGKKERKKSYIYK